MKKKTTKNVEGKDRVNHEYTSVALQIGPIALRLRYVKAMPSGHHDSEIQIV